MGIIHEIKAVLTPKQIVFKKMEHVGNEIYTFIFEPTSPLEWQAGKHAMFFITHRKIDRSMRLFSISSCPLENHIAITTRVGKHPSAYKNSLLELKAGMSMTLRGPMGPFAIQEGRTNCFVAGGIGITPFRSVMKELSLRNQAFDGTVRLFYINNDSSFLFGEELKAMNGDSISTEFFTDRLLLETRLKQAVSLDGNTVYFIAGAKKMTASVKEKLIKLGVAKKNIKTDTFIGY